MLLASLSWHVSTAKASARESVPYAVVISATLNKSLIRCCSFPSVTTARPQIYEEGQTGIGYTIC